ncbi:MAG: hypothetical protein JRI75_07270 [Deltaproteobacteria bacterium]|nr:hypothetical protein [Deltaproteobacteria bacterium]
MRSTTGRIKKKGIFTARSTLWVFVLISISAHLVVAEPAHAQSQPAQAIVTIPRTLSPSGPPEVFGPDTLYEKINGQATLYLSAGFVHLKSQWFAETENDDAMFEIDIYDMGNGLNAFSVFSAQRRGNAQKADFAQFAYQTGYSLHFVHGQYYVEMISAAPIKNMLPMMASLAHNFVKETPVDSSSIEALGFFPEENLDPDSISLITKNAFGFDGLDHVFTAAYTIGGAKVTAFVSKRKTPQEAANLVRGLYQYFMAFGGREVDPDVAIENTKMVEIMDTFYTMFSLNAYFAGIHEASTRKQAEELAERLAITLRKMPEDKK